MDDKAFLQTVEEAVKSQIPGYETRFKDESWSQRFIGFLLKWVIPFNRVYMTNYTTTVYPYVYFPTRSWITDSPRSMWKVLCHELVHLWDQKQSKIWYPVSYSLPQSLGLGALLAFGAFWNLWFLLALGFLVFAPPWPSPWRTRAELRGYAMSMAVNFWRYGSISEAQKERTVEHFIGWSYYRMSASRSRIRKRIDEYAARIESGEILTGKGSEPYQVIYTLLRDCGELHASA